MVVFFGGGAVRSVSAAHTEQGGLEVAFYELLEFPYKALFSESFGIYHDLICLEAGIVLFKSFNGIHNTFDGLFCEEKPRTVFHDTFQRTTASICDHRASSRLCLYNRDAKIFLCRAYEGTRL